MTCLCIAVQAAACPVWGALGALVLGYLLGSVLFAVPVARANGVDIFKAGSGNPGATNVKRAVGSRAGNLVFLLDAFKGFAATAWPLLFLSGDAALWAQTAGLAGALLGHSFSCFYKFRGGKAVSTTIGGLLALMPAALLIALVVWVAVFYASRFVSLASLALGAVLPFAVWITGGNGAKIAIAGLVCVLIFVRHRANIARLLAGTENRFAKNNGKKL